MTIRTTAIRAAMLSAATLSACGEAPPEKPRIMAPIAVAKADSGERWTPCAEDGGTCSYDGMRKVRFGAGETWFHRTASGSIRCDATMFGDPAPKTHKRCEYKG